MNDANLFRLVYEFSDNPSKEGIYDIMRELIEIASKMEEKQ